MGSSETRLDYSAPPRESFGRSTFSIVCSVVAVAISPVVFVLPRGSIYLTTAACASYGLALFFGLGFAIVALFEEKPRRRAAIALLISGAAYAIVFLVAQLFIHTLGLPS